MKNWNLLKKELLLNKITAKEFKLLKPRYAVISQLIKTRLKKGITQKQLAVKIGTKQSAIARLEAGKISPTIDFLEKVSIALKTQLKIQFN